MCIRDRFIQKDLPKIVSLSRRFCTIQLYKKVRRNTINVITVSLAAGLVAAGAELLGFSPSSKKSFDSGLSGSRKSPPVCRDAGGLELYRREKHKHKL